MDGTAGGGGSDGAGPRPRLAARVSGEAPQAAGTIHTDFENGFIRAETMAYADYVTCKGEQGAEDASKMRLERGEYVVQDGDVTQLGFNSRSWRGGQNADPSHLVPTR